MDVREFVALLGNRLHHLRSIEAEDQACVARDCVEQAVALIVDRFQAVTTD
jgi:hypothetical protein